jgi:FKBP-type peptidyl-prolyl cis-trans isomerase 2
MRKTKTGDTIKVHYTGKFEDGTVFDTSLTEGREPISTTLNEEMNLIKGFAQSLYDMTEGEKKTIELEPSEAYGEVLPELTSEVPLENVPEGVQVGDMLTAEGPNGPFNVTVTEVNETTIKVDANHPLAGKKLIFDLELVSID